MGKPVIWGIAVLGLTWHMRGLGIAVWFTLCEDGEADTHLSVEAMVVHWPEVYGLVCMPAQNVHRAGEFAPPDSAHVQHT